MEIKIPDMVGFVIYNPKHQMFSSGGYQKKWTSKGKIWKNIGHIKNHLNHVLMVNPWGREDKKYYFCNHYVDCVVADINTKEPIEFDIYGYMKEYGLKKFPKYECGGIEK